MRGYYGWILGGVTIVLGFGLIGFIASDAHSADQPTATTPAPANPTPPNSAQPNPAQPALVGPRFAAPLTPPTAGPTLDPNLPGVKLSDAAAEEQAEVVSETIGSLAGAYLNQAFLSIGILADAVGKETYEDKEALELLEVHLGLATMVEQQLQALAKVSGADKEEAATVAALIKIAGQIRAQGETLQAVWNGDEAKAAVWEKLREETGNDLERFFGEEEKTQK